MSKEKKEQKQLKNLFRLEQLFNSEMALDDIEDKINDILIELRDEKQNRTFS